MKINDISLLGLLVPNWLALGLQLVLFLQPGTLLAAFASLLASPAPPIGAVSVARHPPGSMWQPPGEPWSQMPFMMETSMQKEGLAAEAEPINNSPLMGNIEHQKHKIRSNLGGVTVGREAGEGAGGRDMIGRSRGVLTCYLGCGRAGGNVGHSLWPWVAAIPHHSPHHPTPPHPARPHTTIPHQALGA